MTDPVVHIDVKELAEDLTEISDMTANQITENILNELGTKIEAQAKENAPFKSGRLRDSITHEVGDGKLTVSVGVEYGRYQEFGTGSRSEFGGSSYKIRPKNKKFLKFKVNGKTVFAKEVTHPGVHPQPFLRPAVTEVMGDLYDKLAERGQALILKGPKSDFKT